MLPYNDTSTTKRSVALELCLYGWTDTNRVVIAFEVLAPAIGASADECKSSRGNLWLSNLLADLDVHD
jgi:hypothetical protein